MSFDRVARPYRWLEYLTFGPALTRCRRAALPWAAGAQRALLLGDGDGRFTAALLRSRPALTVDSIDGSAVMLRLAAARARAFGRRARFYHADALALDTILKPGARYDFVATHFFLDCLDTAQVAALVQRLLPRLAPEARWILSEFAAPNQAARVVVRLLYLAFRVAAGLEVQQLPDYEAALSDAGFQCLERRRWLGGLLVTGCWALKATTGTRTPSQQA